MEEIIRYITTFLLGEGNEALTDLIAYSRNSSAPIVIQPSSFFDPKVYMTELSMPQLPLQECCGVPVLFGDNKIVRSQNQYIVYADFIASSYFLMSRYEECICRNIRDQHGRFTGKDSLPFRGNFLLRPIVDEYGKILREFIRELGISVDEPSHEFKHIYLTHDVDEIWRWGNLQNVLKTFVKKMIRKEREVFESFKGWYDYKKYDPIFTFPWLVKQDQKLVKYIGKERCTSVFFIKGGGHDKTDDFYYKKRRRVEDLIDYLLKNSCIIGLHASFSAGKDPDKIKEEKKYLENIRKDKVYWNRNHYLCSREPEDMEGLIAAGITDDFTMGYADQVGFRLGTCQPVQWINPLTKQLTSLVLHPMVIMDCTLNEERYMNLDKIEAFDLISKLVDIVKIYHGELVLLWHNTSVVRQNSGYHRELYKETLHYIFRKSMKEKVLEKGTRNGV